MKTESRNATAKQAVKLFAFSALASFAVAAAQPAFAYWSDSGILAPTNNAITSANYVPKPGAGSCTPPSSQSSPNFTVTFTPASIAPDYYRVKLTSSTTQGLTSPPLNTSSQNVVYGQNDDNIYGPNTGIYQSKNVAWGFGPAYPSSGSSTNVTEGNLILYSEIGGWESAPVTRSYRWWVVTQYNGGIFGLGQSQSVTLNTANTGCANVS